MKKSFLRAALAAALLGSAAIVVSAPAYAADSKSTPQGPTVSKPVGIALYAAQKLMEAGDYAGAMEKIKEAQAVPTRTPDDDYQIEKFMGYVAINLKDNATAFTAFDTMAHSPVMPDSDKLATYQNALVLAGVMKNYAKVIEYGKDLEQIKPLDDKVDAMMSQAYYLTNDPADSAAYAQKSVDAAKAAGHEADPFVLEILMSAQTKSNNQSGAVETLEQIAVATNEASNWTQLTELALTTPGIRDLDALYIYRLRFMAGGMKNADDYTIMARIADQLGYAVEAKDVLIQGVQAGKIPAGRGEAGGLLAKTKGEAAADESALSTIAAAAARSKNGEQDVKLAEDYWGYGRFADAEAAARSAISKGGLKDPSEGDFILGISLIAQGKNVEAEQPLSKIDGTKARAKAGHLWYLYAKARARQMGQEAPPPPANPAPPPPASQPATPPAQH